MTTAVTGGILPADLNDPEFLRAEEEHRKRRAEEAAHEAELAARAAEIERTCDSVDKTFSVALRRELAAENKVARVSRAVERDFRAFQKCAAEWGLPHLPAPPQAVVLFLAQESEKHTAAHITRLRNSIDVVHRATSMPSPCGDVLVRAVMRAVNEDNQERK